MPQATDRFAYMRRINKNYIEIASKCKFKSVPSSTTKNSSLKKYTEWPSKTNSIAFIWKIAKQIDNEWNKTAKN